MSLLARILDRFITLTTMLMAALLLFSSPAAAMQPLAEAEMDDIVASGFSSVTLENDTAKLWLNIHVETHAYIESFKANHHSGGWDQEWYDVYLGTYELDGGGVMVPKSDEPLKLQGFILEAEFDDIESDDRRLLSFKMGFNNVNGTISADDFASFTGYYDNPRTAFYRQNPGGGTGGTFTFDDDYIHVIFDARGDETDPSIRPGIYMDFGNAEFN